MIEQEVIVGASLLMRGRLSNALTTRSIDNAKLRLHYRQGGEWLSFTDLFLPQKILRMLPGGWYRVAVPPRELAAKVHLGVATEFRLGASHPAYQDNSEELAISAVEFSLAEEPVEVLGESVVVSQLAAAPFILDVTLTPKPVMLAGLLISDNDPEVPVADADVTITTVGGSTVSTDSDGRFRFDTPPMALSLNVFATDGSRNTTIKHTVDFTQPVNTAVLSLTT